MSEQFYLLDTPVSEHDREHLESLARRRGYNTVGEYLMALAEQDAQAIDEDEDIDVADRLRQAFEDVKAGRVYPYERLREMLRY